MSTRPGLRAVLRDLASFIGGWALIFQQAGLLKGFGFEPPAHPSEILILVGALAIGVPGIQQVINMRTGGAAPTASPSSAPASVESPSSSPGASSGSDNP